MEEAKLKKALEELTKKSRLGEATSEEHRLILQLMVLLHTLPANRWWESEV